MGNRTECNPNQFIEEEVAVVPMIESQIITKQMKVIPAEDNAFIGVWANRNGGLKRAHDFAVTGTRTCKYTGLNGVCSGELRSDGKIYWSDGDIWSKFEVKAEVPYERVVERVV